MTLKHMVHEQRLSLQISILGEITLTTISNLIYSSQNKMNKGQSQNQTLACSIISITSVRLPDSTYFKDLSLIETHTKRSNRACINDPMPRSKTVHFRSLV